ncbi:hypothetical protein HMPREF3034_01998 [Prevotella sp. DNF00663]|nr:hypothetical protein HMPREF3034_01998 [Prevotella sp. DNF00663]
MKPWNKSIISAINTGYMKKRKNPHRKTIRMEKWRDYTFFHMNNVGFRHFLVLILVFNIIPYCFISSHILQ